MGKSLNPFKSPKPRKPAKTTTIVQNVPETEVDPNFGTASTAAKKRARQAAAKRGRRQLRVDLVGGSGEGQQTRTGLSIS